MMEQKRTYDVSTYFTEEELAQIKAISKATGLSMSGVIRMATLYVLNEVLQVRSFAEVIRAVVDAKTKK